MVDINKIQKMAEQGEDQTVATKGSGKPFDMPKAGTAMLRLVSYIEIGEHTKKFTGKPDKDVPQVMLQFELLGKNYPATAPETDEHQARETPFIITITENKFLSEKANFFKLFTKMNQDYDVKHMSSLVGKEFLGTVVLTEPDANGRVYANLRDTNGYTIRPPYIDADDGEGGVERKRINVPKAVTPLKIFLWDYADQEQWDSLFIDGVFNPKKDDKGNVIAEGKSKNWIQERILAAKNFKNSPVAAVVAGGDSLDLDGAETPPRGDPLDIEEGGVKQEYDLNDDIPF